MGTFSAKYCDQLLGIFTSFRSLSLIWNGYNSINASSTYLVVSITCAFQVSYSHFKSQKYIIIIIIIITIIIIIILLKKNPKTY